MLKVEIPLYKVYNATNNPVMLSSHHINLSTKKSNYIIIIMEIMTYLPINTTINAARLAKPEQSELIASAVTTALSNTLPTTNL